MYIGSEPLCVLRISSKMVVSNFTERVLKFLSSDFTFFRLLFFIFIGVHYYMSILFVIFYFVVLILDGNSANVAHT